MDHQVGGSKVRGERHVMDVADTEQRPDIRVVRLCAEGIDEEEKLLPVG
jgi:hypothetical protein